MKTQNEKITLGEHYEQAHPLECSLKYEHIGQDADYARCFLIYIEQHPEVILSNGPDFSHAVRRMKALGDMQFYEKALGVAVESFKKRLEKEQKRFPRIQEEYKRDCALANDPDIDYKPPMMFATTYYDCKERMEKFAESICKLEQMLGGQK